MNNTKRSSLLIATAMLLIAVLAATGATYAWFTSTTQATASISLGVTEGGSIEISTDNTNWASTATISDLEWNDYSLNVVENQNGGSEPAEYTYAYTFYDSVLNGATVTGFTAANNVASKQIHLRSTSSSDIIISAGSITAGTLGLGGADSDALLGNAAILIDDNNVSNEKPVVCANSAGTVSGTVNGTSASDTNGSYDKVLFTSGTVVVTLGEKQADGYYYGTATLYFFLEGTVVNNGDLSGIVDNATIDASMTFSQATE